MMSGILTVGLLLQLLVPSTVEVPAGRFQMGSDIVGLSVEAARSVGDEWRQFDRDEGPVHTVFIGPHSLRNRPEARLQNRLQRKKSDKEMK